MSVDNYAQEASFIERVHGVEYVIRKGFVPNMNVSVRSCNMLLSCLFE